MLAGLLPRVRRRDDLAYALLIETLEPLVALQVLQVRSDRAVAEERLGLRGGDQPIPQQSVHALLPHRPALTFGEGLSQVREIGERLHRLHAGLGIELALNGVEVEGALEVVHPGLEQ